MVDRQLRSDQPDDPEAEAAGQQFRQQQETPPVATGGGFGATNAFGIPEIDPAAFRNHGIPQAPPLQLSPEDQDLAGLHAAYLVNEYGYMPEDAATRAQSFAMTHGRQWSDDVRGLADRSYAAARAVMELDERLPPTFTLKDDIIGAILHASDRQLDELEAHLRTTERRVAGEDASRSLIVALTTPAVTAAGGSEDVVAAADFDFTAAKMGDGEVPAAARFLDSATGREMRWQTTGNSLAADIEGTEFRLRLDEPIGDTALDALVAIANAIAGSKHSLLTDNELPGHQTRIGAFNEWVGDVTRPLFEFKDRNDATFNYVVGNLIGPGQAEFKTSEQIVDLRYQEMVDDVLPTLAVNPDDLLILAASAMSGDGGITMETYKDAEALYAQMSPAERERLAADLTPPREQVEKSLEGLIDDRHSVKRGLDTAAAGVFDVAQRWEAFVQGNFISVVDFLGDTVQGIGNLADGTDKQGFFDAFEFNARDAYEGISSGDVHLTAADYFNVPDAWRGVTNLVSSLAGDPFTWVTLGAAGRRGLMEDMLTTRAGQDKWIRTAGREHLERWEAMLTGDTEGLLRRVTGTRVQRPINTEGLLAVALDSGLGSRALQRIRNGEAISTVVRDEMADGLWVPALGGLTKMRDTASNIARMISLGDNDIGLWVKRQLTTWETSRNVHLGADRFMDDFLGRLAAATVDPKFDKATLQGFFDEALELTERGQGLRSVVSADVQGLYGARRMLASEAQDRGLREYWELAARQAEIEDQIRLAERSGTATDDLAARLPYQADEVADLRAASDDWLDRWRANSKGLSDARRIARNISVSQYRSQLQDLHKRFWDSWFDAHGLLSETGVRQTAAITGAKGQVVEESSKLVTQLGAVADIGEGLATKLGRAGALSVPSRAVDPVSPLVMVAWASRKDDNWWRNIWRQGVAPWATRVDDMLRKGFTANVLLNPFTFVRSNLDEPLRHGLQRGWLGRASRVAEIPGGAPGVDRVIGGAEGGVQRLLSGVPVVQRKIAPPDVSTPYARSLGAPVQRLETPEYVARSRNATPNDISATVDKAGTRRAAQSLTRTLSTQPLWQRWARSLLEGDVDGFVRWWDDVGRYAGGQPVKRLNIGLDDVKPIRGDLLPGEVLEGLDTVLEGLLRQVAPSSQDSVRRAFLNSVATGAPLSDDIASRFSWMPAFEARDSSVYGKSFERFFGRPAEVHGGIVWTDFYEQTRYILETRHADRIATPQRLSELSNGRISEVEAARHLWASSDEALDIVSRHGLFTPKQIHVEASKVATRHAEHMAYKMGAATMFGQKLSRAFPFLKAQMDFTGYYYRELLSGTAFGLNPTIARALRINTQGVIPHWMPLNLRLAGRMMDYAGTLTTLGEDYRESGDVLQTAMDRYSFLPAAVGDSIWLQLSPGLAPLPSWALHMLPTEYDPDDDSMLARWGAALRDFSEAVMPTLGYFEDRATFSPSLERGLGAFVFGNSTTSLRRLFERVGGQVATHLPEDIFGWDPVEVWSDTFGAPPGVHTELRINFAELLAANPNMIASPETGAWRNMIDEATREAYRATLGGGGMDYLESLARKAGVGINADDGQYLRLYEGLVEDLGVLYEAGLVDDRQADEITELWGQWTDGMIEREDAVRLADVLSDVLFGVDDNTQAYLVVKHPELVGNMVSRWKVDPATAPLGTFTGDRLVVRPGQDGRELRERGYREGWLFRREPTELAESMWNRYGDAVRDLRNYLWEQATDYKSFNRGVLDSAGDRKTRIGDSDLAAQALGITPGVYTFRELFETLDTKWGGAAENVSPYMSAQGSSFIRGTQAAEVIRDIERQYRDAGLSDDPRDMTDAARAEGRRVLEAALNNPVTQDRGFDKRIYDTLFAPYWGELDYTPPSPPGLDTVPVGRADSTYRLTVDPRDLVVIDGDTVAIEYDPAGRMAANMARVVAESPFTRTSPDAQRIRLIGVNAVEQNSVMAELGDDSYAKQTDALEDIIRSAETIDFVVFDAERFGTLQSVEAGEVRWLMVMYVNGVPLWDESVFTSVNPRGAGLGGEGVLNLDLPFMDEVA